MMCEVLNYFDVFVVIFFVCVCVSDGGWCEGVMSVEC